MAEDGVVIERDEADQIARVLRVPAGLGSHHFFYRTKAPRFNRADVDAVVAAARSYVETFGIGAAEIRMLGAAKLEAGLAGAGDALRRLSQCVQDSPIRIGLDVVLVCEWASPHIDHAFAGKAFCSFVLATGEHPYIMQTMHTEVVGGAMEIVTSTRVLNEGDGFVFDPLTPHLAVPKYSSDDQLLVMLHIELEDGSEEDRAKLLEVFPPLEGDQDEGDVIGG